MSSRHEHAHEVITTTRERREVQRCRHEHDELDGTASTAVPARARRDSEHARSSDTTERAAMQTRAREDERAEHASSKAHTSKHRNTQRKARQW